MTPHITICICTYCRPAMLERLLHKISLQKTAGLFTFSIVVTDNDANQSARVVVKKYLRDQAMPVVYTVEPERNIALARNMAVAHATGDFIAFIDDDELPEPDWLMNLFCACKIYNAAGVLGPVKPHFEQKPPQWLVKGGFYERPEHPTGFTMLWRECRTGNVLIRRDIFNPSEPPFRYEFGTGGEDQDFFHRMIQRGNHFIWCNEAIAYEIVPPSRWTRRFMIHRALLRGRNTIRHHQNRVRNLLKSLVAVPAYALALPVLFLAGQHRFMKYLVKLADHLGRLLASVGINPATERRM